jgi:hypothetical protein
VGRSKYQPGRRTGQLLGARQDTCEDGPDSRGGKTSFQGLVSDELISASRPYLAVRPMSHHKRYQATGLATPSPYSG